MRNGDMLIKKSTRAVCHPLEREVVVKNKNLSRALALLRSKGMRIIGTGDAYGNNTKIWFINRALAF